MNLRNTLTLGSLLVALAGTSATLAIAQQTRPVQPNQPTQPTQPGSRDWNDQNRDQGQKHQQMRLERFSNIKGANIHNSRGDTIGSVDDLVITGQHGEIDRAVIRTGTILGMGGKTVAIPFQQLTWNWSEERFEMNTNVEDLRNMPEFDRDNLTMLPGNTITPEDRRNPADRRVNPTDPNNPNNPNRTNPADRDRDRDADRWGNTPGGETGAYERFLVLASDVNGADIRCAANDCGDVEDVIVDVMSGRVVLLSIDPDQNFLGMGDTKRLAPWSAARWNEQEDVIELRATRDQLTSATETPEDLKTLANRDRLSAIYRGYGVEWSDRNDSMRTTPGMTPGQRSNDPNRPGDRGTDRDNRQTDPNRPGQRQTTPNRPNN